MGGGHFRTATRNIVKARINQIFEKNNQKEIYTCINVP